MRVAVIGAGLVGLTTAHALHKRNMQVTLIEAEDAPGTVTSYANGAQLSYSYTDPLASPALLRALPAILAGRSPGIRIRHKADVHYLRWAASFLWHCLPHQQRKNAIRLEELAARSAELMEEFHENPELDYYHARSGKLVLLETPPNKQTTEGIARKRRAGSSIEIMDRSKTLEIAPQLHRWNTPFTHSIFSTSDDVADPNEFSKALAKFLAKVGVEQRYSTRVTAATPSAEGICLHAGIDHVTYDAVVICTGSVNTTKSSHNLLRHTNQQPAIYPIAGYSLSLRAGTACPEPSITVLAERLVMAKLADRVRIAGFADINPNPNLLQKRLEALRTAAERIAPEAACYSDANKREWIGYRPSTPGGPPDVGATSVPGLFKNVGHGSLGWTLAAATAELVAHAVEQQSA